MQNKQELIYRSILVILCIAFLAILYGYSENGRYACFNYKKINEIDNHGYEVSAIDTRTGTIYQHSFTSYPRTGAIYPFFYKAELTTGKILGSVGENYKDMAPLIPKKDKQSSK